MPDPSLCPLCGKDNLCAVVADSKASYCWCKQQIFGVDIIERAQKAQQCICQPCAKKAQQLATHAKAL